MAVDEVLAPLGKVDSSQVPNLSVREIGWNGLHVSSGSIIEELDSNLRWPNCIYTYKKMLHDSVISSATTVFTTLIASVPWYVSAPKGYYEKLKPQVRYLETVMHDMDHSWLSFINQATSYIYMGFAPHEIVLDTRLRKNGSRYNDGLYRIKKLPLRSQDTILGWEFKNKGRDLSGLWQAVNKPQGKWNYKRKRPVEDLSTTSDNGVTEQFIPKEKILLFRNNPINNNPEGVSPLKSVYRSWKYRTAYEEAEAQGVVSDVHGLKVLYIPPEYMTPEASPENKEVYATYQKIMRNIHIGQESGLILPMFRDEIKGDKLFEFEIVNSTGQKAYDIGAIINRLNKEIYTALYADFLILGQEGGGSFALSESKQSLVQIIIRSKLEEIRDVLNHHLIPLLFKRNYELTKNEIWNTEVYPTFEFGEAEEVALAEFAKAWQQVSATKGIPKVKEVINEVMEKFGFDYRLPENITQDELERLLDGGENKVGQGMQEGLGGGTGKADGSKGDNTAGNSANN